jgi:segregation and condensation protein A
MSASLAVQQVIELDATLPVAIEELPDMTVFALINGQPLKQMPQDLYIPPEALEVFLETFEGPLDLLLYLIKKQNLDILDIKVAEITRQYMDYVALMEAFQLELAAEYLVMAATLGEIKSRCLLPRPAGTEEDEADPRQALIERLQNYERFKKAAEQLDQLPRCERDYLPIQLPKPLQADIAEVLPSLLLENLLFAFKDVIERAGLYEHHRIAREPLSIRERMTRILGALQHKAMLPFVEIFNLEEGRQGVVVSFIAMLELIKESLIEIVQAELFAPIYLAVKSGIKCDAVD